MKAGLMGAAALALAVSGCISVSPIFTGKVETVMVEKSPRWFELNRIALVDVDGFIGSSGGLFSLWGGTTVAVVKEKLERAAADKRVVAVVLRVNSPGGTVTASDMMYQEVMRFKRNTGKPVVATMMDTATSGAYYVSLASDRIVASPSTVTGSVGVLMEFINVEGLFGKIGLRAEVIKSGEKKDIGSPTRALTPEERALLQNVNLAMFQRFTGTVRAGRPAMTDADVATISDGRIVTAQQALDLHMVDRVGYLEDAIAEARALAGVGGADVILYRAFPSYNSNIYANPAAGSGLIEEGLGLLLRRAGPTFLYLWSPGT